MQLMSLQVITAFIVTMVIVLSSMLVSRPSLLLPGLPRSNVSDDGCVAWRHDGDVGRQTNRDLRPCPLPGAGAFSLGRLTVTALYSFPGSGNTWLRHLLTTATGILTAAVYNTERDVPVSPDRAHRVLVVKTHLSPKVSRKYFPFERAVLLLRNPYDALLAEFNRRGNYTERLKDNPDVSKTGVRTPESFEKAWPRFLHVTMDRWLEMNLAWARDSVPVHVVVYHRLQSHLQTELRHALVFLNHSHTGLLHCALRAPEGRSHRKREDWQRAAAVFTARQKRSINAAIDVLRMALERKTGQNFSDFRRWKR